MCSLKLGKVMGGYVSAIPDSVNGCPMDSKFCNPFGSVRMRFLSVSCPVNAFLQLPCQAMSVLSRGKFCSCSKLGTDTTGQRHPLVVRLLCAEHAFWPALKRFLSCTSPFASSL